MKDKKENKSASLLEPIQIFKQGWKLLKERWGIYLAAIGLYYLFSLIPLGVLAAYLMNQFGRNSGLLTAGEISIYLLVILMIVFVSLWFGVVKLLIVLSEEKKKIREYLKLGLRGIWSLFWTQILSTWFVMGLMALALVIPIFLSVWLGSGYLGLLLIPGLLFVWWYSLHFVFVSQVVVMEKLTGFKAMIRSFGLVEKRVWPLLGRLLILLLVQIVFGILGSSLTGSNRREGLLIAVAGIIFGILSRMIPVFYLAVVYKHFKKGVSKSIQSRLANQKYYLIVSIVWIFIAIGMVSFIGQKMINSPVLQDLIKNFNPASIGITSTEELGPVFRELLRQIDPGLIEETGSGGYELDSYEGWLEG